MPGLSVGESATKSSTTQAQAKDLSTQQASSSQGGKLKLVALPCRKGGPWAGDGNVWERWRNGEMADRRTHGFRLCNGVWQYQSGDTGWPCPRSDSWLGLAQQSADEIRAPKDYDGPCPEGFYFIGKDEIAVPVYEDQALKSGEWWWVCADESMDGLPADYRVRVMYAGYSGGKWHVGPGTEIK